MKQSRIHGALLSFINGMSANRNHVEGSVT